MAKRRSASRTTAAELPQMGDVPQPPEIVTAEATQAEPTEETVTETKTVQSHVLTISVPFIEGLEGYSRRRVDVTLSGKQAKALKGIQQGLESKDAQLESGRFVSTPLHAIQWMLENAVM